MKLILNFTKCTFLTLVIEEHESPSYSHSLEGLVYQTAISWSGPGIRSSMNHCHRCTSIHCECTVKYMGRLYIVVPLGHIIVTPNRPVFARCYYPYWYVVDGDQWRNNKYKFYGFTWPHFQGSNPWYSALKVITLTITSPRRCLVLATRGMCFGMLAIQQSSTLTITSSRRYLVLSTCGLCFVMLACWSCLLAGCVSVC